MAALSTTTTVGWVVSPIIRKMVSLVQSYISSQYSWKSEMMSDLKKLEAALIEILLVVGAAERRNIVDRNQTLLLHQMKDAVCDAEDMLDEFDYMLLRKKVEHQSMARHIASSSFSLGKRLIGFDKFKSKLRKVLDRTTRVRACAEMLARVMAVDSINTSQPHECVQARATGSLLHEDIIFGRREEVDKLVSQLLKQSDQHSLTYCPKLITEVHTIVGIGGIGKTTLAQLIYNDDRITDAFDLKMWICVSNCFDKIRITKEMVACAAAGQNIELTNFSFSQLQDKLNSSLFSKRFLLVLDDVWYDENFGEHINRERWKELLAPIKDTILFNAKDGNTRMGSKILVTTRTELVSNIVDSRSSLFLQGLQTDDSLSLFQRCAFGMRNPEDYMELKRISDQIVKRLEGSPLALKVVGGHLNGKYNASNWNDVLLRNVLNPNDILTILRLSYDGLPEHLQQCFAYCSLFPKGFYIDLKRLIHMWIAQGFVRLDGNANMSLEDIGKNYFNDLLTRSFFQMLRRGDQIYHVMHDSMNDLALHVSEGECFRIDEDSLDKLPGYIRHLSVSAEHITDLVNYSDLRSLRSLIILNKSWFCSKVFMSYQILDNLKSVRVLDLTGCCLESLPDTVGHLIHLRYLATRRIYHPLPATLSKLYHLQALFVCYHSCYSRNCVDYLNRKASTTGGSFALPESISKLVNLMHVDIEKAYPIILSNRHQLPCLEGSGEFLVDKEQSLVGLKDLNKLRGDLTIRLLENVKGKEEAAKANLDLKEHIAKLELEWGTCDNPSDVEKGIEVLDVLKPHDNLAELTISGYPGSRSPSWLESGWLGRVQFICLRDCKRWEVLPPLGDLPLLRTLEVRRMEKLKTLGQEFFGSAGFPALQRFLLERLPRLEWCLVNYQVFPNLRHLSVAGCPRLREYPTHPCTLKHVAILDQEHIRAKFHIDRLDLSSSFCRLVSSFFHVLHAHHLEFIEHMEIYVNHVAGMSREVFNNLKSLKQLRIYGINRDSTCSVVNTLWDKNGRTLLPSSLRLLDLERCYLQPSSFSILLNNLSSLDTLRLSECDTVEMPCPPVSVNYLRMLKQLHIYKCDWISYFEGSEALVSLEELKIDQCYDLEYVPDLDDMPCLQKLHLYHCPQVMRLSKSGPQTTLKELEIRSCIALSSLEELCDLVSLTELSVSDCPDLLRLPDMDGFYSLRVLRIDWCQQLRSLPRSGLPVSLETFCLSECHQALEEQFQRKEGPDWNKVAALPGCMYGHENIKR